MDSNFTSVNRAIEKSITALNEQIKKVDWNEKWRADYKKTEKAMQEVDTLENPDFKEGLKEIFSEESLVISRLGEVF